MNWNTLLNSERIRPVKSKGTSKDLRTEFEKDYHRIIGSASFRRLQDKTQVFPLDKSDYIRTRLTHSLEVSSLAKSLGQNVGETIISKSLDKEFGVQQKEDICAILQCAGLLHDIGNPPFGHFGEDTIRDWFKKNLRSLKFNDKSVIDMLTRQQLEDFNNFEGNTQALRVVTKLHFLVDENGMNLTKALLGTIIKYPVSSIEIDKKCGDICRKKMGYFAADREIFDDIQDSLGTYGRRHPLCFLLEAADDIAYRTADIEDSVKKKCISYNDILSELKAYKGKGSDTDSYSKAIEILERKYNRAIEKGVKNPDMYAVQNWIVSIQGMLIYACSDSFIDNYEAIMSGAYNHDLFHNTEVEGLAYILGDIAYRRVFLSKPIFKLEIAAGKILDTLLEFFVGAIINFDTDNPNTTVNSKLCDIISEDYKRIYNYYSKDKSEEEKLYLRLLLVTDYICGMTDSYAKNLYQELCGII